jgi:hypothetical protein
VDQLGERVELPTCQTPATEVSHHHETRHTRARTHTPHNKRYRWWKRG